VLVTLAFLRTGLAREALGVTCQAGSCTTGRAIGQIRPLPARPLDECTLRAAYLAVEHCN
jgi:hypothetical protein